MSGGRFGKPGTDAPETLAAAEGVPHGVGWGNVMSFEGWSARRARQAQRALGLRLVERGGSIEDVRPKPY